MLLIPSAVRLSLYEPNKRNSFSFWPFLLSLLKELSLVCDKQCQMQLIYNLNFLRHRHCFPTTLKVGECLSFAFKLGF